MRPGAVGYVGFTGLTIPSLSASASFNLLNGLPSGWTYTGSPKLVLGSNNLYGWAPHNLLLRSSGDTTGWTTNGGSLTANQSAGSDGLTEMHLLTATAAAARVNTGSASITGLATYNYAFQAQLRAGTTDLALVGIFDGTNYLGCSVQLSGAGTIRATNTGVTASINHLGGGLYQVFVAVKTVSATTSIRGLVGIDASSTTVSGVTWNTWSAVGTETISTAYHQLSYGLTHFNYVKTTSAQYLAPANEYNSSGRYLGARSDPSRTNISLWSDDLTNAAWVKTSCTAAYTATGADGVANSATTLTSSASNGTCLQSVTSTVNTRQLAAFVRRRTGTGTIDMTIDGGTTWQTITITSSWAQYRIEQASVTNPNIGFRIQTNGDAIDVMWVNLMTSSIAVATSPIPTTTANSARAADIMSVALGSWFNATRGVFANTVEFYFISSTAQRAMQVDDGTTNERFIYPSLTTSVLRATAVDGGATGANQQLVASPVINTPYKNAMKYKASDYVAATNGTAASTSSSALLPTVTTLRPFSNAAGTENLHGWIKDIAYYSIDAGQPTVNQISR